MSEYEYKYFVLKLLLTLGVAKSEKKIKNHGRVNNLLEGLMILTPTYCMNKRTVFSRKALVL